jgi:TldD protein
MRELVHHVLDMAKLKRADYADIRLVRRKFEEITVKNGKVTTLTQDEDWGLGIRVFFRGTWGFACCSRVTKKEAEKTFRQAWKIARESSRGKEKRGLFPPRPPTVARYETPFSIDPWSVAPDRKIRLLLESDEILRRNQRVRISEAFLGSYAVDKTFASTEGAFIEQNIVECGAGISATAIEGGEVQVRSYPNSFRGNFATGGYEWIEGLKLKDQAGRIAEEAAQLLSAKPCPAGVTTVILDGAQLALQVHESIGHPIELDRILGSEASYAGTSFLSLAMVGSFQYASPQVNIVADATVPGGLGTFGYDDEGTKAQRVPILTRGRLTGLLTSRETAPLLDQESNGTMRADGWNRLPLIRMTNINLEPGAWKLEQMIADTEEGLLLSTNRSWSIDDRRINFQFGTEIGWEIKKGRLGAMIKNPIYTGITPDFWNSCDAVADRDHWQMWGTPNCGKGEPGQVAHVGHGVAPARFRNVQVGVIK